MIINKHDKENEIININGINYNIFVVNNVKSWESDDTQWIVDTDDNNESQNKSQNESQNEWQEYFILDSKYNEAFAHWVYENAIYIPLYMALKQQYPKLRLVLLTKRNYKNLFLNYFCVSPNDICYIEDIQVQNKTFFYDPISFLNDKEITETYKEHVNRFIDGLFEKLPKIINKTIDTLLMPRQKLENYKNNDRTYDTTKLENEIKANEKNYILHTDTITDLHEQMFLVRQSKNIILTDGSPLLVNGIFAIESKINVIGTITLGQQMSFPKINFIIRLIAKSNKIIRGV
jgi:hypothetical protein